MTNFKDALAKFTSAFSFQEKGKFPSQPQQNPKGLSHVKKSRAAIGWRFMSLVVVLLELVHLGVAT